MFVDENFYLISKAFNKLVNISSYCIVNANKIYCNIAIKFTIKNFIISIDTSFLTNACTFAYANYA